MSSIYSTPGMFFEVLALFLLICYPTILAIYMTQVENY
jgi:hypothetical protein